MEVLRLSLRRYRFFPEFGARLPINSSAGCGTRRPSGGPGRMSFRCAPRVPDRSGLGAACPAVVRRLRYLRRAIICFHVPNSRIRSFHIRQPWLAVSYCVPTMKSFSSSDFMRRNRKLENRYDKTYDRGKIHESEAPTTTRLFDSFYRLSIRSTRRLASRTSATVSVPISSPRSTM